MKKVLSYNDIYEFDIKLMKMVIKEYGIGEEAWKLFYEFYEDPDVYPVENGKFKMVEDIKCTVDGLLSVNRIKQHENGLGDKFVEVFKKYRKTPIIYFPSERWGINVSRSRKLGDRIDHTLYDLKNFCEGKNNCRLQLAYEKPKTSRWIKSFDNDFDKIVKWMGIQGIFVNEDNEVYDLEYSDDRVIHEYCETYSEKWSDNYYNNIKQKIELYEKNLTHY